MPHHHNPSLSKDLETLTHMAPDRRRVLHWLTAGGAAALPLMGCGGGGSSTTSSAATSTSTTSVATVATSSACTVIPTETAGPYPGDGTNSVSGSVVNALTLAGIVRSDIKPSFAGATGVAAGVPLTVTLKLVNTSASCASLAGYAVYLWHCDRNGLYSMYSAGVLAENYLRGVQVSDSNGEVTFSTIFPACYSGRWPHIHFEVFASQALATSLPANDQVRTSQLALPKSVCDAVFATTGYSASVANLAAVSLASDGVFGNDSAVTQMPVVTGSVAAGYVATLTVGV